MIRTFRFYERYGVEDFYGYDPDSGGLSGWQRRAATLEDLESMAGWVSPRPGVRFDLAQGVLQLYGPDGNRRTERLLARLRALGSNREEDAD